MILKTEMEVAQYYTDFNYGPPRPQKDLKYQNITILEGTGMNLAPKCVLLGNSKGKVGKNPPPHMR